MGGGTHHHCLQAMAMAASWWVPSRFLKASGHSSPQWAWPARSWDELRSPLPTRARRHARAANCSWHWWAASLQWAAGLLAQRRARFFIENIKHQEKKPGRSSKLSVIPAKSKMLPWSRRHLVTCTLDSYCSFLDLGRPQGQCCLVAF